MTSDSLTRTVYWSPSGVLDGWLHYTMYLWLACALGVCAYGIYRRTRLWRLGQKEVAFDRPFTRCLLFFRHVLAQGRVLRSRRQRDSGQDGKGLKSYFSALMHGLLFYGFLALVFGTTVVALKDYGLVDLYHGWFYAVLKVVCQLGGIAVLVGLGMGIIRRSQPETGFAHGLGYSVFYFFLFALVLQGFLLQGLRLAYDAAAPDRDFAFVGELFSFVFPSQLSTQHANVLYSALWYVHMLTTMGFLAILPYTRAMHIVTASLNLYTQRLEPKVLLAKMDFSKGDAEYFGARDIRDFTWKDLLSFESCTECRRCTDICPANAAEKPLDPREIILKLKNSLHVDSLFPKNEPRERLYLYESGVISQEEVWACTNCGACVETCPVGIDQLRTIMQLRRYQTLTLGDLPASAGRAIENIKQYQNPWGLPSADRFRWAESLGVPVLTEDSPEVEYLYYVGCAGAYDPANQTVVKSVVSILKHCKVDFAVMGKAEKCTGEPVKRLGDEYAFSEIAISNVEQLSHLKFKKIVTHCPHCFNTLKNDYKEYGGVFQVFHHSQLLADLVKNGRLILSATGQQTTVTFHDPCFLGRHNGEYEAPREVLAAIAGLKVSEMELSRESSHCCGMGGGNMWYESEGGQKIVETRLGHVAATGADTLVTGCSFCLINFKSTFKNLEKTKNMEVIDIAEAVLRALPTSPEKTDFV